MSHDDDTDRIERHHTRPDDSGGRAITGRKVFRSDLATLWVLVASVAFATGYAVNLKGSLESGQRWMKQCILQQSKRIDTIERYLKFPGSGSTLPDDPNDTDERHIP